MKDFGGTLLRIGLGGIALYNAGRFIGVFQSAAMTTPLKEYTDRLAAANVPQPQIVAYVVTALLVLGGLSVLFGFLTRQGAFVLAMISLFHLLSGPATFEQLEGVERATRLAAQLHVICLIASLSLMLQGSGYLAMKPS